MIYGKESEEMGRKLLGNDAYDSIAKKVGIPGGEGHKLYEDWRALPDNSPARLEIAKKSKAYYETIRRQHAN